MNLEKDAIEILQTFASDEQYHLADSGGKDSAALRVVTEKSGVPFSIYHSLTTVDAPETVYYVRRMQDHYLSKGINYEIIKPTLNMEQLIVKHGTPPTRLMRYCCEALKEAYGKGLKVLTGVRKSESRNREENQGIVTFPKPNKAIKSNIDNENFLLTVKGGVIIHNIDNDESRRVVESCYRTSKTLINPMLNWDDEFTWWYIRRNNAELNPLYDERGYCRVGCIGCPMSGKGRWKEFADYPKYKDRYIRAFDRMLIERKNRGLENKIGWETGYDVFLWWMEDENIRGQIALDLESMR